MKKKYKNLRSEKGAISIFTVLAMIFFLLFVVGAFTFASRRNQTQVQSLSELRALYKKDGDFLYNALTQGESTAIPIYSENDFSDIGTGIIKTINGKNYTFLKSSEYIFKNNLLIDIEKLLNGNILTKDFTIYNDDYTVNLSSFDVFYMYDYDGDGEKERYKLIAYSKNGKKEVSTSSRNEKEFNILNTNIDKYKFGTAYTFLTVSKLNNGKVNYERTDTTKKPTRLSDIDSYNKLSSSTSEFYTFIKAEREKIEVTIDKIVGDLPTRTSTDTFRITIVNNTEEKVNYTITPKSDKFNMTGQVTKVELEPKSSIEKDVVVSAKSNLWYTNVSDPANIAVNVVSGLNNIDQSFDLSITTFNESLRDLILAFNEQKNTPSFTNTVTTESLSGLYHTVDESGTTQYFRGVVENNYVSFAGKTWRIIRINGDKSYRIILNNILSESVSYSTENNASYRAVGYMYGTGQHDNTRDSNIKVTIDKWYENNLKSYSNFIDTEAIFWCDRDVYQTLSNKQVVYNGWGRVMNSAPSLKATTKADMFSVGTTKGNGALKYPIGTITSDEIVFAGGALFGATNNSTGSYYGNTAYYLYSSDMSSYGFWTMTPRRYDPSNKSNSLMMVSKPQAVLYFEPGYHATTKRNIKPVINLKSTVKVKGTGTKSDPYVIKEE